VVTHVPVAIAAIIIYVGKISCLVVMPKVKISFSHQLESWWEAEYAPPMRRTDSVAAARAPNGPGDE
jgi:hypothetical protein